MKVLWPVLVARFIIHLFTFIMHLFIIRNLILWKRVLFYTEGVYIVVLFTLL